MTERNTLFLQVEALVSHIVGSELDGGPAALLRGWAGLSRNALDAVAEQQGGKAAGNAVLIFMTGAEEINRTVQPPRLWCLQCFAASPPGLRTVRCSLARANSVQSCTAFRDL